MSFVELDSPAVARALCLISEAPGDIVDAFFERREVVEVPPRSAAEGVRVRREEGLSLRLVSGTRTWLAVRDEISRGTFDEALRRVARRLAQGVLRAPSIRPAAWPPHVAEREMADFERRVASRLRSRRLVFPLDLGLRRHRRWIQVVSREVAPGVESECFYSCRVRTDWGEWGTLLPTLDEDGARTVADALAAAFRARSSPPPAPGRAPLLLGPSAAAVLLHEAVAHALEVDTLALSGDPEAAVGVALASEVMDLLDDPTAGPEGLRRVTDDEGVPVLRRWLLRRGKVEQPLADRQWALRSAALSCGAARRQSRHSAPVPRSLHLELLGGEGSAADLAARAGDGLFASEAVSGRLDPLTGEFRLRLRHGRRLAGGELKERVGSFWVRGQVGTLLSRIGGVGGVSVLSGAGWCAKGGQKMPVWSTTPPLLLDGVEVVE